MHLGMSLTDTLHGRYSFDYLEDIPNNFVENAFFDEDTHYPHSMYLWNRSDWYNGTTDSGTNVGVRTPVHWRLFSPIYTTDPSHPTNPDYRTARGLSFLAAPPGYQDLAEIAAPTRPDYQQDGYDYEEYNPSNVRRAFKIFGIGDELIAFNAENVTRTFNMEAAYPPMMSVCDDWTSIPTYPSEKCWVKYELWSDKITIPANAVTAKYGAYVRCPPGDLFRDDNFGGIYVQQLNRTGTISDTAKTSFIAFHKPNNQPSLKTGSISGSVSLPGVENGTAMIAQYYWGGLAADQNKTGFSVNSHITQNVVSGTYKTTNNYASFEKVEQSYTLTTDTGFDSINIGLYFCENQDNLDNSGTPTGSIEIYQPYIQFYDSNGDIISS